MLTWSAAVLLLRRASIGVLLLRRRLNRPCQDRGGYDRVCDRGGGRRSRGSVLSGSHLIEVKGSRSFAEVVIDIGY